MSKINKKKDNLTFKALSAIGIILVICGHFDCQVLSLNGLVPYDTFHMPLFMFISGYFFKEASCGDINDVKSYIWRKTKHLLFPYLAWNFVYGLFHHLMNGFFGFNIAPRSFNLYELFIEPFLLGDGFGYNVAAWFLMTLYLVEVIGCLAAWLLRKIFKDKWLITLTIGTFGIALIAAVKGQVDTVCAWGQHSELAISVLRTSYLLFWYVFAMFYRRYLEEYAKKVPTPIVLIGVLVAECVLSAMFQDYRTIVYHASFFNNVFVVFFAATIGCWFWIRIAEIIAPILMRSKIAAYISDHTFSLMMHQGIAGMIVSAIIVASGLVPVAADQSGFFLDIWFHIGIAPPLYIIYPIAVTAIVLVFVWVFEKTRDKVKEKLAVKEASTV